MKHVWDIDFVQKADIYQMSIFELREYAKRLEEKLLNKDKTIMAIIDGNRRPHGEWIEKPWGVVCSRCKSQALHAPNGKQLRSDFCPNCGADMRKEGEAE